MNQKFDIQAKQYKFPYHYIPHFDVNGIPKRYQALSWGLEYLCYQKHIKELVESFCLDSMLEVGCGDGRFIGSVEGVKRRVGVDLAENAIRLAVALNDGIEFHCADASCLNELFDACVAIEVLEHIPDDQVVKFIKTLFERTNPGGYVIISVPSNVLPVNKKHYRHYSAELLADHLGQAECDFEIVNMDCIYSEPIWLKWYLILTYNRYWLFEFNWFRKVVWNRIWSRHRHANRKNGRHIVAILRKAQ